MWAQALLEASQPSACCLVLFFKSASAILQSTCCCCRTQQLPSKICNLGGRSCEKKNRIPEAATRKVGGRTGRRKRILVSGPEAVGAGDGLTEQLSSSRPWCDGRVAVAYSLFSHAHLPLSRPRYSSTQREHSQHSLCDGPARWTMCRYRSLQRQESRLRNVIVWALHLA